MASSKTYTLEHRTKFPALPAGKFRLTIEQGRPPVQLAHLVVCIHKDTRPQGYQLPAKSLAMQSVRRTYGTYTTGRSRWACLHYKHFSAFFNYFPQLFLKKYFLQLFQWVRILKWGWAGAAGGGGFGRGPGPPGRVWKKYYIYAQTDDPRRIFCTFPIDLVVVLRLFPPHNEFNERSPVTGEHRSTHERIARSQEAQRSELAHSGTSSAGLSGSAKREAVNILFTASSCIMRPAQPTLTIC